MLRSIEQFSSVEVQREAAPHSADAVGGGMEFAGRFTQPELRLVGDARGLRT